MTTQANHIQMRLGPKKRHVTDSLTLAKQVLDLDVECDKLEGSALICWEIRDHLRLYLDGYKSYILNWKMLLCRKGAKSGRRYVMRQMIILISNMKQIVLYHDLAPVLPPFRKNLK